MDSVKIGFISFVAIYHISRYLSPSENVVYNLPNTWWGPGNENKDVDNSIRPFKIIFDNKVRNLIFNVFCTLLISLSWKVELSQKDNNNNYYYYYYYYY